MKTIRISIILMLIIGLLVANCKKDEEPVDPPLADFACDQTTGDPPLIVNFTSKSTGSITSYAWDFGDGELATTQNAVHTFSEGGAFVVTHTVIGPGGSNSADETINVNLPDPPVAGFTCDVTIGEIPLSVKFTSTSTGEITSYLWEFGDGGSSNLQNPTYIYNDVGTFMAELTVTGPGGDDSHTQTIKADPISPPEASITCNTTSGEAPLTVNFTSTSTGNITSYSWDFGDGGSSSAENPDHTYYDPGTFTAKLEVNGPGGSDMDDQVITVTEVLITDIMFTNPVFTDIYIELDGIQKVISPGGSVTYYDIEGPSISYSAYTQGKTSQGTLLGEKYEWNETASLPGGSITIPLNVNSDYFFLYMRNYGTDNLVDLYVNYNTSYQTYDNILLPNDNVSYRIAYYRAFNNTEVRMYFQNIGSGVYWTQGTHFNLPWTINQSVELKNDLKSENNQKCNNNSQISNRSYIPEELIQANGY